MDTFNAIVNGALSLFLKAFSWAPPILGLAVISVIAGIGMLWVFRKTSNQTKIRAAKKLVHAHLLELRIYRDEPSVMWRAQASLFRANLKYIALMLQPALWMAIPFAILIAHLEGVYGVAPLALGTPTVVTAQAEAPFDPSAGSPSLSAPTGVVVESSAVRLMGERQVSWRIRAKAQASGELQLTWDGDTIEKQLEAGNGQRYVSTRRVESIWDALWHPGEPRIRSKNIQWIEVAYPDATIRALGIGMPWLAWFLIISALAALLLKKMFRVTF